ncbi:MAG: hypothetical protein AAGE52_00735 [Myxococcota bacterium]
MNDELIEEVAGAYRAGGLRYHAAWYDLSEEERREAHARALRQREFEAALDPEGLSSTARAVLARIA